MDQTSQEPATQYNQPLEQQTPAQPTTQVDHKKGHEAARNFFLYFLVFAMLYLLAINLGGILFEVIDKYFADAGSSFSGRFSRSSLRFHVSSIIVATPIFLFMSRKLYKDSLKHIGLRTSAIRRWLTYITLLVTTLVVVGDLIALVNSFLKGDTTLQFVLRSLVVLVIATSVLIYYLQDLKTLRAGDVLKGPITKGYFIGTITVTILAIIFGILSVGSPAEQRKVNRDDDRINNLRDIEASIQNYYRAESKLPKSLDDLEIRNASLTDPETDKAYTYKAQTATKYELCATFETSNKDDTDDEYYYEKQYLHEIGETCFTRAVVKPNSNVLSPEPIIVR